MTFETFVALPSSWHLLQLIRVLRKKLSEVSQRYAAVRFKFKLRTGHISYVESSLDVKFTKELT